MRSSIGAKIFGLAAVLLALNLVLAVFLVSHVRRLGREMRVVAERDIPLDTDLSRVNGSGMLRRLAFEREFAALVESPPDRAAADQARGEYDQEMRRLSSLLDSASGIVAGYPTDVTDAGALAEIGLLLQEIREEYPETTRRQGEVLDLARAGQVARARAELSVLGDEMNTVQRQRERLEEVVDSLVQAKAALVAAQERRVLTLTMAATVALVALGLVLARILTQRLVHPVRELVGGIKVVEQGDLSVSLPVRTADEIGTLTSAFNVFIGELRGKEEMRRTFGKYVDPRILDEYILKPGATETTGRRDMTVGFSDLVGFSALGESLTPAGLVNLLNRHFSLQADAIQQHRGIVDKFIGDAVMAFWGAPFTSEAEHAELACRAALAQMEALAAFRRMIPELTGMRKNLPHVDARIGLNTGDVVVGNIGSENTRSYTVIGDAVNLASRLEGANRPYGTRILISESTRARAGERVVVREIDALTVKGKQEPTRVFELLGLAGETADGLLRLRDAFEPALAAYRARDWTGAEAGFHACLALEPEDRPARLFLERVRVLRSAPPDAGWNGVWSLESK